MSPDPNPHTPYPLLISTWSFGLRGHEKAWPALAAGGSSLDAVETVCRTVEADPEVDSVGIGGLPDRDGRMSLDGAVMLGPDRCGAVAGVSRCLHVVSVARQLMERTDDVLLVGAGADRFAAELGYGEEELLTPETRAAWEAWSADPQVMDQSRDGAYPPLRPVDETGGGKLFRTPESHHDTISAIGIDGTGQLAAACSTSGTPFKRPGRVGDVPLIGHGIYADPAAGAAVATGNGELVMPICGSFLAVELMRSGRGPLDALAAVLDRIITTQDLRPEHQLAMIAVTPDGQWRSATLRPGFRVSVTTADRHDVSEPDLILDV